MNKDEMKGKWEKAKGYVKDKAGEITGDPELEAEGENQQVKGEIQEAGGKVRRKVGEAMKKVGEKIEGE